MSDRFTKKQLIEIIKWLVIVAILFFICRQIIMQWDQIKDYQWKVNWLYLIASIIVLQFGLFFKSCIWSRLLHCFGASLPILRAFRVAYLSNLGRYIPGKFMQFVGIMYLAKKEGLREDVAASSFALIQLFDTPAGLILIVLYYLMLGTSFDKISQYMPVLAALIIVTCLSLLIILKPSLMERLLNLLLKLIKQPALKFQLKKKTGLWFLFLYFIAWNIFGAAFYLFLISVTDVSADFFLQACLIYAASYMIGYWALFAPGGIGVREGVMGVLLNRIGGILESVAFAVSLAARLWFMTGEILVSILALMVRSKK